MYLSWFCLISTYSDPKFFQHFFNIFFGGLKNPFLLATAFKQKPNLFIMDTYIFNAYFFGGQKQEIIVKAKSRFSAYGKATIEALKINSNLDFVELEKSIYHF